MTGKGSVNHNSRKFHAKNTDPERSYLNIEYCNENIKDVYHELFDEALARYNEKQTRSDRRIDDYYEKIRSGKQEKPFHEIILQIGDKDNMGAKTENGQLAAKVLDKYMKGFQRRNPTLRVFSAYLHMDEATANVDPENEDRLQKAIEALTRNKTIIMIAHRLKTVRNADQILVIDDGQIVQQSRHEELIGQEGIYVDFVLGRKEAIGWKLKTTEVK